MNLTKTLGNIIGSKPENTKTKVISELNTKLQDCVELSKAYELKELEFYKLINLVQEMSNMFENNKTFVDDYMIQMTKTVEEQKNKNNDLNKFYEDKINYLLTTYKINDDYKGNSLNDKKNKQAEALKKSTDLSEKMKTNVTEQQEKIKNLIKSNSSLVTSHPISPYARLNGTKEPGNYGNKLEPPRGGAKRKYTKKTVSKK
jgi:NAD+--asparagine ADP-ribosyltransferase